VLRASCGRGHKRRHYRHALEWSSNRIAGIPGEMANFLENGFSHPVEFGRTIALLTARFIPAFSKMRLDQRRPDLSISGPEYKGKSAPGLCGVLRYKFCLVSKFLFALTSSVEMLQQYAVRRLAKPVASGAFYFLRFCERMLPVNVLSILLWVPAACWDLLHVRQRMPLACWRRFPESWRPKRWRFVLRQTLGLFHAQLLYIWPDRLRTERWLRRCRLEGGSQFIGPYEGKRAAVGVSLHFGPIATLPYWLRAHGIVQTSVRTPALDSLKGLTVYQFSLSPPADVPVFLSTSDIGSKPRLSTIRNILGPNARLGMLIDVDRGKQFYVRFEDRLFRMATGAIRLAQTLNADLVPVLIAETAAWKYTIHFGTPVPQNYLGNSPDLQAIGTHLLQEFSKVITRYPEQCNMRLLRAMFPLPEQGVADLSAVVQSVETP
jgi:lauroyl/myristoyl acyltransferase